MLGRSATMQALHDSLRAAGLHPILIPEAVKLTVIKLTRKHAPQLPRDRAFAQAAELLAYCVLGHVQFAETSGEDAADRTEARLEAALDAGDSLDAKLILLALHAGLLAPEITDRIDLDAEQPGRGTAPKG